jgi:hypothetical protein
VALGATHHNWRPDVHTIVRRILAENPSISANTYTDHPWPGWDEVSVDFWGPGGRGDPIDRAAGLRVRRTLMELPGEPYIRHTIWMHQLWTSFGGWSWWEPNDHSGRLRHLHVTYWK